MPLSEHEQRILDEIEKNLHDEDPRLARQVRRSSSTQFEVSRAKLGAATFVCGFLVLIAFFVTQIILVGVLAFGAMVAGIVLVASSSRGIVSASKSGRRDASDRIKGAVKGLEERIRKRYKKI